jgi:hypothetical protein
LIATPGGDVIRLVLRLRLERQQPSEFLLDLRTVGPSLAQQCEDLIVVLSRRSFTKASATDGVGGIDAGVNREAGRCDVAAGLDFARRGVGVLLGLARIRTT